LPARVRPHRRPPPFMSAAGSMLPDQLPTSSGRGSAKGDGKGKAKGGAHSGKGKSKGKAGAGGRGDDRQRPYYDSSSPCGYFVAGYCRSGGRCSMQHSVTYALAVRSEWLQPEDQSAKDALRAAAEQTLGASGIRQEDVFPRVFSRVLSLAAPCASKPGVTQRHPSGSVRRWNRAKEPFGARLDDNDDGFAWEQPPDRAEGGDDGFAWERPRGGLPEPAALGTALAEGGQRLRHLLIFDLEGKYEIIEFPVIAIDLRSQREVGRFQRFVRPLRLFDGYVLTPDSPAAPFPEVLEEFEQWMRKTLGHGLDDMAGARATTAFLTCGDWDCKHVHTQCGICGIPVPSAFRQWVNVKRSYSDAYGGEFRGMKSMLARLKLLDRQGNVMHGFHHLGMHDVENIGRCVLRLLEDGVEIQINGWMT